MKKIKLIALTRVAILLLLTVAGTGIGFSPWDAENAHAAPQENRSALKPGDEKKIALIIAGHGDMPNDFPKMKEYLELSRKGGKKFEELENELIHWPRNENNDSYWAGISHVAKEAEKTKVFSSVSIAFNEFCSPTVKEALEEAAKQKPDEIIVSSIMITPGGGHSESDIPATIKLFEEKNPGIKIIYAWPYEAPEISAFLVLHAQKFISK